VFFRDIAAIDTVAGRRALIVGKAYHAGLEWWRRQPVNKKDPEAAAHFAASQYRQYAAEEKVALDTYTASQVFAYVLGYCGRFAEAEEEVVEQQVFEDGDGESGTADCVSKFADGTIWVVEDKTTARFDNAEAMQMSLIFNDQISTYVHALRTRGIDVKGAKYRQVRKTMTKQTQKESTEDYLKRIVDIYTGEESATLYREFTVTWSDAEMDRCLRQRDRENMDIISHLDIYDVEKWPYNPLNCIGPYGPCDFVQLCAKRRDASQRLYQPSERTPYDGGNYQAEIWQHNGSESCVSSRADIDRAVGGSSDDDLF
jgi:hypothetical protein